MTDTDRLAYALADLFTPEQLDDLHADAWRLSLPDIPAAADWGWLARAIDHARRIGDHARREQPEQKPADDWPLPAVEIEQAESAGLVVRPESPAVERAGSDRSQTRAREDEQRERDRLDVWAGSRDDDQHGRSGPPGPERPADPGADPACRTRRPERGDRECGGPVEFAVTYRRAAGRHKGELIDYTPGCGRHCAAESTRAALAGTIAAVNVELLADVERERSGKEG